MELFSTRKWAKRSPQLSNINDRMPCMYCIKFLGSSWTQQLTTWADTAFNSFYYQELHGPTIVASPAHQLRGRDQQQQVHFSTKLEITIGHLVMGKKLFESAFVCFAERENIVASKTKIIPTCFLSILQIVPRSGEERQGWLFNPQSPLTWRFRRTFAEGIAVFVYSTMPW